MGRSSRVLKFTTTDTETGYVLLNVVSRGSQPLDLKIEATEGDHEYGLSMRHDKVSSFRVEKCPVSDEAEWQDILVRLFGQKPQPHIQATAVVRSKSAISIMIRNSTQGITQRLGEIKIPLAKNSGYNVLDWCATAADAVVESKDAVASAMSKVQELEATVGDLKKQLEELIQAKEEDETTLLFKFRDLLNEKKVKIREQQKIIATLPTATDTTAPSPRDQPLRSPSPPPPRRGKKATKSRASKRKAPASTVEESSEDQFEDMETDKIKSEPEGDSTDAGNETEATASTRIGDDTDDDEEEGNKLSPNAASAAPSQGTGTIKVKKERVDPPPSRVLPFFKNKTAASTGVPSKPPAGGNSDTDSDDEL